MIDSVDKKTHQLAWRSFKEGDFKGAWQQAKALFERSPGFAPAWDIASRVALAVGNGEMALDLIDRALAIEAGNFACLTQKAYCLLFVTHKKFPYINKLLCNKMLLYQP